MNVEQQKGKQTAIEARGYAELDSLHIAYFPQHVIADKFCVDAFIPSMGIVMQFDGDYWHGNPSKFSTLSTRQTKRIRLDRSQDAYLLKCGYRIIRFWESDLKINQTLIQETLNLTQWKN